jgi:GNAT superfamily N-acetyltransferase
VGEITVVGADDGKNLRQFIEFPYQHYRSDPYWVPPLRMAQRDLLDKAKHPFYRHAEMQCFLAVDEGQVVVGRVAAILDRSQFSQDHVGFFGFLEMIDSEPVANALLRAAWDWVCARGAKLMRGPVNPSTNYECGLLVDGFDSSPFVMMTYNPPYYSGLIEHAGLKKAKDLLAYVTTAAATAGTKAIKVAERRMSRSRVVIRPVNLKKFEAEVDSIWSIYTSAWSQNWGFAPLEREEFQLLAKDMKMILAPEFALIGEIDGRPVGFALALPDINRALKPAGGNLFPFGLIKILYHKQRIKTLRVMALGVIEEFRTAGVAAGFYATLIRQAQRLGYGECEFSWVLEDNILMNRSIESLGARRYKTYRLYEGTYHYA